MVFAEAAPAFRDARSLDSNKYPVDIALSNFQTETCFLVEFEVANGHRKCTTTEGYLALVRVVIYWPRKTGSVFCRGTELSTVLVKKIVTK